MLTEHAQGQLQSTALCPHKATKELEQVCLEFGFVGSNSWL